MDYRNILQKEILEICREFGGENKVELSKRLSRLIKISRQEVFGKIEDIKKEIKFN